MSDTLEEIRTELRGLTDPSKARQLQRFFKTGSGQYGEGDVFLGITVPDSRKIAKSYQSCRLEVVSKLLCSKVHEERLVGLLILVFKQNAGKNGITSFYLKHLRYVNNWDLVDLSAPSILGPYADKNGASVLYQLARSEKLWESRIAIVSTYYLIKKHQFLHTLKIAEILLHYPHDLIHKATGWMLREIGKRDPAVLEKFLNIHAAEMPRTTLRYAVERLPERKKRSYMQIGQQPRV